MNIFISLIIIPISISIGYTQQGRLNLPENTFHLEKEVYWIVDSTGGIYIVSYNGYLGLVNEKGQLVCDAQFDLIEPFTYSEATTVTKMGKYGIINRKGELVAPCEYETMKPFGCSVTAFEQDSRWGIINDRGKIITLATYHLLSSFHDGMGIGMTNNVEYILIDSTGKTKKLFHRDKSGIPGSIKNEIYEMLYQYQLGNYPEALYFYHDGIAKGINLETFKYCFVDKSGTRLFDKDFEFIFSFEGKYAAVKTEKGWNYIDRNGNYKSDIWYPELALQGPIRIVEKNNLYGVLDTTDKVLIPFKYQAISALNDSLFAVLLESRWGEGSKWGVLDIHNKTILACIYEGINFDPKTSIGNAGIYEHSTSLNTGIPRYIYHGHYFLFDHSGIIDKKEYPYSMLIEGISDWHIEGSRNNWVSGFAPPLDVNNYGLIVHKQWGESILGLGNQSNPSRITVTNQNGKEIISASGKPYVEIQIFPNCIVVRDNDHSITYDHFGNRIYKTKDAILDRNDNGTFRVYTDDGNKSIDAHGNLID